MGKIILITGGARSGKSRYALELAESIAEKRLFVATSPRLDPEMKERIDRHKQERAGRNWDSLEEELHLSSLFTKHLEKYDVVLIDCLTLWINNLLYTGERNNREIDDCFIRERIISLINAARKSLVTTILVTNEVGLGIVPANKLARKYRDLVGIANQTIGRVADDLIMVSCGVPLVIKSSNL